MSERKFCISCGMPLRSAKDYPSGDTSKKYCIHCANEDGEMKTFSEMVESMTQFMINTQGMEQVAAREKSREMLLKNEAWKNKAL